MSLFGSIFEKLLFDSYKNRQKKKDVCRGILTELRQTKCILSSIVMQLAFHDGTIGRDLLQWHQEQIEGTSCLPELEPLQDLTKSLLSLDEKDLEGALSLSMPNADTSLIMKRCELPYLEANIDNLTMFDENFHQTALDINRRMGLLNDEIDLSRKYFDRTFDDSMSETNHNNNLANLNGCYKKVAGMARDIIDSIDRIAGMS